MKTARANPAFTLVEIMIVVVIIGLLAAMAIPAFQKARSSSQDKSILNNLRQLSSGAVTYYLERGVSSVATTDLMGSNSSQYVKAFQTIAGESYPAVLVEGTALTASGVAGGRTITYGQ